jgi:hypothetical protein
VVGLCPLSNPLPSLSASYLHFGAVVPVYDDVCLDLLCFSACYMVLSAHLCAVALLVLSLPGLISLILLETLHSLLSLEPAHSRKANNSYNPNNSNKTSDSDDFNSRECLVS